MPRKKSQKPFSQQEISNTLTEGKEETIIIKDVRKRAMLKALIRSLGVVAYACEEVGISRQTHYTWLKTDLAYKEVIGHIYEASIDYAEARLFRQIKESDLRAIMFILRTRGKARGYSLFKENLAQATKEVSIIVEDEEMAEIVRLNKENP
jgi:hypothetical protein